MLNYGDFLIEKNFEALSEINHKIEWVSYYIFPKLLFFKEKGPNLAYQKDIIFFSALDIVLPNKDGEISLI